MLAAFITINNYYDIYMIYIYTPVTQTSSVIFCNINYFEPQFPSLQNGETNCLTYVISLASCQAHNK